MFFQSKKVLGLDIGTTSIKVAELDVGRRGATLAAFAIAPTPPQVIINGDITDPAAITETVKGLITTLQSKRQNVACSIYGNPVIVKKVSIPKMEEKMIAEQIKWEAEQYIPFDINEVNLDYRVLKGSASPENMDVLLVAAKQEAIFHCTEIVESLGKSLTIVDVAGFSLAQCYEKNYGIDPENIVALVDVGGLVTNVTVVDRGDVVFSRDIMLGGSTYSSEIQKGLGLSLQEAEAMKISASQGQAVPEELNAILTATHQPICEEILASLDFFLNASSGKKIGACFVTGGGSRTPGMISSLSAIVKTPCQPLDPFRAIKYNESKLSAAFISQISDVCAVALGLGLRNAGDA